MKKKFISAVFMCISQLLHVHTTDSSTIAGCLQPVYMSHYVPLPYPYPYYSYSASAHDSIPDSQTLAAKDQSSAPIEDGKNIDRMISKCFMTECHDWVEECRWFCDSVAGLEVYERCLECLSPRGRHCFECFDI